MLFLFSIPIFERFTWALTEPLFFTLLFVNFIVYYLFLHSRKPGWVIGLGVATSILFLARYVGIFMAAVWLPAILLLTNPNRWLKNIFLFLVGLLPLMSIHLLRNYLLVGSINNRGIYLQGMPNAMGKIAPGLSVLEGWFTRTGDGLSSHVMTLIIICLLIVSLLAVCVINGVKLYKQPGIVDKDPGRQAILFPLSLALLIYIATVLLTVFYYDSQTLLDDRMLSPVYFFGLYFLMLVADIVYKKGWLAKILVLACLLAFLAFSVVKFINGSAVLRSDGQGFISAKWRVLPGVEYIRQTNRNPIYTDEPLMAYILTGKIAFQVPYTVIDESKPYEENYQHYDYMRTQLFESDGILVLFEDGCHTPIDQWTKTLIRDLRMIEEFANTCVYSP